MKGYSAFALVRNAFSGHRHWKPVWRTPELKKSYDVVIIGAGGHGLATAYYLAKQHGVRNVAVLEKGFIGGGNTGRNTQVTRSNYFWPQSAAFFDHSLKLYENLSLDLNFNVMLSQRGVLTLAHSHHELESLIEHRYSIEGKSSPIPKDLVRLSIGIESVDDLIADLEQALS
jgi:sarcosine oxidase subunit beta